MPPAGDEVMRHTDDALGKEWHGECAEIGTVSARRLARRVRGDWHGDCAVAYLVCRLVTRVHGVGDVAEGPCDHCAAKRSILSHLSLRASSGAFTRGRSRTGRSRAERAAAIAWQGGRTRDGVEGPHVEVLILVEPEGLVVGDDTLERVHSVVIHRDNVCLDVMTHDVLVRPVLRRATHGHHGEPVCQRRIGRRFTQNGTAGCSR